MSGLPVKRTALALTLALTGMAAALGLGSHAYAMCDGSVHFIKTTAQHHAAAVICHGGRCPLAARGRHG